MTAFTWYSVDLTPGPDGDGPDVDVATGIIQTADISVTGQSEETRESVRGMLTSPDAIRGATRIVRAPDGSGVGFLLLEDQRDHQSTFLEAYATSEHAEELYPQLLRQGAQAARRLVGAGDWTLETAALAEDEISQRVLAATGFTRVRRFWRMHIDISPDATTIDPPAPEGVALQVASSDMDKQALHAVDMAAFVDHFGFTPRSFDEWMPWFAHRRDARPDLWWLALRDGGPVGLCICDDSRAHQGLTYVRVLGVRPESRGRGIARWLLRMVFAQAAREGRVGVCLSTDSENTTGAVRLYEGLGMRAEQVIDVFRRPLPG
jgi:mycothiol synthase